MLTVTFRQTFAAAAIATLEPLRVSPGNLPAPTPAPAPLWPASTQRILPAATSSASHEMLTVLSRPEKPPIPATLASLPIIAEAALDWLATAIVPPPCCLT